MKRALLAALMLSCAEAAPLLPGMRVDPVTTCRFVVPAEMGPGTAYWEGDCPDHLAEGPGVIRVVRGPGPPVRFAGRMHAGQPVQGMVDPVEPGTTNFGPAYRYEGAHAVYPTTHEQVAEGFRTAASGAAEASRRFLLRGNTASSKFYASWSEQLARAPDENE